MAGAPVVASILVGLGAMCFSLMSLSAKMASTEGHLSAFTLLAVRSAIGLLLNLAAGLCARLRERQTGRERSPLNTEAALTPSARLQRRAAARSRSAGEDADEGTAGDGKLRGLRGLSRSAAVWLTVRALAGFGCVLLEYAALKVLPLKVNAMIVYSSPAFIVLWAAVLLRQRVRLAVIGLIGVSFGGLVLEVRPWMLADGNGAPLWAYLAALVAAALAGLVYVSLRALAGTSYLTVMNTFLSTCLVLSVSAAVPLGEFSLPEADPKLWACLIAVGVFAYLAEVLVTCGYQRAGEGTGQVSVLKFLSPVFSMLWGCLVLGEHIEWTDLAGAALILGSSAAIVLVQARKGKADSNPKVEDPSAEAGNPKAEGTAAWSPAMAGGAEELPSFCLSPVAAREEAAELAGEVAGESGGEAEVGGSGELHEAAV